MEVIMARKTEDISNKKYGLLTVIRFNDYILVGSKQRKAARFLCKCDCGSETIVRATHLKSGVTKSCGHIKTDSIYDIKQLPSQKFNRLTVVRCTGLDKNKREKWLCTCDCGKEKTILRDNLTSGKTQSCGCLHKDICKSRVPWNQLPVGDAAWNRLKLTYHHGAKSRNLEFELSLDDIKLLCTSNCNYCGVEPERIFPPKSTGLNGCITVNGIDRIDNKLGYTKCNCVTSCEHCNRAKMDLSIDKWNEWVKRFVKFNTKE